MNDKPLNSFRNLFFYLIVSIGLFYTLFLIQALIRSVPGGLMQLIFLLDTLKSEPEHLLGLIFSFQFVFNLGAGILALILGLKYFNAIIRTVLNLRLTGNLINSLRIIRHKSGYFIFHSLQPQAFTSGFLSPKIFISDSLVKQLNRDELKAVYRHELKHRQNLDPLKELIVKFISLSLPPFWGKRVFFNHYASLVEINCDQFAQLELKNKRPLVSALLKISSVAPGMTLAASFSGQNERIKVLVGKAGLRLRQQLLGSSLVLFMAVLALSFVSNTNFFYNCNHIWQCVTILFAENKNDQPLNYSPTLIGTPVSSHCSQL